MSQAYLEVVERFIGIQEIMCEDDKNYKKSPKKTARIAAMLVMATLYSKFPLDKQYAVFKAMKQTMTEKLGNYKALGESVDDIAASLILTSELNKIIKK